MLKQIKKKSLTRFTALVLLLFPLTLFADLTEGINESIHKAFQFFISLILLGIIIYQYFKKRSDEKTSSLFLFLCSGALIICSLQLMAEYKESYAYNFPLAALSAESPDQDYAKASGADDPSQASGSVAPENTYETTTYSDMIQKDSNLKMTYAWFLILSAILSSAHALYLDFKNRKSV